MKRQISLPFLYGGRSVDFYTLFVELDRQIVLIIMAISVEMVYEKKTQ